MGLNENHRQLFDRLFREQQHKLLRHCLRFAPGRRDWAMDRVHDTFVKLGRNLPILRQDSEELAGWLYTVSTNECLQALRQQERFSRWTRWWRQGEEKTEPTQPSPNLAPGMRSPRAWG